MHVSEGNGDAWRMLPKILTMCGDVMIQFQPSLIIAPSSEYFRKIFCTITLWQKLTLNFFHVMILIYVRFYGTRLYYICTATLWYPPSLIIAPSSEYLRKIFCTNTLLDSVYYTLWSLFTKRVYSNFVRDVMRTPPRLR